MYPEDQLYGIFTIIYLYTNIPYKSTIHVSKYTLNRWYGMKKKVVLVQLHIGFPKKKKESQCFNSKVPETPISAVQFLGEQKQISNSFLLLFEL